MSIGKTNVNDLAKNEDTYFVKWDELMHSQSQYRQIVDMIIVDVICELYHLLVAFNVNGVCSW